MWVGDTAPDSVHTAISQTVATGYEILEFSLHDSVNLNRDKTRELLTANGIQATCSRGLARDADVSSDDPAVVARGAALLRESVEVTHAIGATILTGALYSAFGKAAHPLTPTGRAQRCGRLKELAAEAAPLGVTLGLEICNRYETNVVNTARDCLRLADDIGADNVVIHLDTYHMNIEESDVVTPVHDSATGSAMSISVRITAATSVRAHRLRRVLRRTRRHRLPRAGDLRIVLLGSGRTRPVQRPRLSGATSGTTAPIWPATRAATSATACATPASTTRCAHDRNSAAGNSP